MRSSRGIPGGGRDGPAPSADGREWQLGRWQEDTCGPIFTFRSRTRPPCHGQAPAPADPTFFQRSGLRSLPPPPPAPIHCPPRSRPSTARRGNWHSPGPIATLPLQSRHQSAPAGGGAAPMSLRLLPGPQDPFCLGRAKLGLSSRHFREEAFPSGLSLGLGSCLSWPGFCNFPPLCSFRAGPGRALRALPSRSGKLRNGGYPDRLGSLMFAVGFGVCFRISCRNPGNVSSFLVSFSWTSLSVWC